MISAATESSLQSRVCDMHRVSGWILFFPTDQDLDSLYFVITLYRDLDSLLCRLLQRHQWAMAASVRKTGVRRNLPRRKTARRLSACENHSKCLVNRHAPAGARVHRSPAAWQRSPTNRTQAGLRPSSLGLAVAHCTAPDRFHPANTHRRAASMHSMQEISHGREPTPRVASTPPSQIRHPGLLRHNSPLHVHHGEGWNPSACGVAVPLAIIARVPVAAAEHDYICRDSARHSFIPDSTGISRWPLSTACGPRRLWMPPRSSTAYLFLDPRMNIHPVRGAGDPADLAL